MNRRAHIVFGSGAAVLVAVLLDTYTGCCGRGVACLLLVFLGGSLGGWLPDIDLKFKHRMLFHNIFALLSTILIVYVAERIVLVDYFPQIASWIPLVLLSISTGFLSHVFLDMATTSGVALLYPLSRKRYRYARLHSNSTAANTATILAGTLLLLLGLTLCKT